MKLHGPVNSQNSRRAGGRTEPRRAGGHVRGNPYPPMLRLVRPGAQPLQSSRQAHRGGRLRHTAGLRYNVCPMARGWESKAVEDQREAAATGGPSRKARPGRSAEEQERVRKREDLQLARKRVAADLAAATHPRHRELLERTLADLDSRIRGLESQI